MANMLDAACTARSTEIQSGVQDSSVDFRHALAGMSIDDFQATMGREPCQTLLGHALPPVEIVDPGATAQQTASDINAYAHAYIDSAGVGKPEAVLPAIEAAVLMNKAQSQGFDYFADTLHAVENGAGSIAADGSLSGSAHYNSPQSDAAIIVGGVTTYDNSGEATIFPEGSGHTHSTVELHDGRIRFQDYRPL